MSERGHLAGATALIVEDQMLIAIDLEEILEDAGVTVLATLTSTRDAIDFLAQYVPDIAILDIDLGHETSEPVARLLLEQNIPFVFATGYDDNGAIPADLSAVPVVRKPFEREGLRASLRTAMGGYSHFAAASQSAPSSSSIQSAAKRS